jgi:hypothetical protein
MRASYPILAALLVATACAGGESFQYTAEWRLIHAGDAVLSWQASGTGYQARLQLRSAGLVSMLYRVNDLYVADVNEDLCAISSTLTAREGSRSRETRVIFDGERRKASYVERDLKNNAGLEHREIDIPPCVHEVIGALYRLRASAPVPVRKSFEIPISNGKKSVMGRVEAQQQEEVETPAGRFKTIRYEAYLFNDVLYHRSARLHVWLTDDERRTPVQIRVRLQFPVGTITLQLVKVEAI